MSPIVDLPLASKIRSESNSALVYMIGNTGNLYKVSLNTQLNQPYSDSVVGIASVKNGTAFAYGASMEFAANASVESIFIGHDNGVNAIRFNGSAEMAIGNPSYYITGVFRPLRQFVGKVMFGNGPTVGAIDATGTVTSPVVSVVSAIPTNSSIVSIYSQLDPPFPPETVVQDLDVTPSIDYLLMTSSNVTPDQITSPASRQAFQASDSALYKWNGVDSAATAGTTMSAYSAIALQTYLSQNLFFSNDAFGSSVSDGVNKILTLPRNKAPFPNATGSTGSFLYWVCPEVNAAATAETATLYYFGALDQESPSGLYRLTRITSALTNGFVVGVPMTTLVDNSFKGVNNSYSSIATIGYGKHYISTVEVNGTLLVTGTGSVLGLYGFTLNPSGTVAPQLGVYETQTQLFSKRIAIAQIRIYCEPTATGNGFQLDIIGGDGTVVNNGTFTYSYGSVVDPNNNSSVLERINFNPSMDNLFSVGIRITNTGTTNMTIKKIEVDWSEEGK